MGGPVALQCRETDEGPVTHLAPIGPLSRVHAVVLLQGRTMPEGARAGLAAVGALVRVYSQVLYHRGAQPETAAADLTLVRFLTRVQESVTIHATWFRCRVRASVAGKRLLLLKQTATPTAVRMLTDFLTLSYG